MIVGTCFVEQASRLFLDHSAHVRATMLRNSTEVWLAARQLQLLILAQGVLNQPRRRGCPGAVLTTDGDDHG
jgi:hypothetical protein